MRLAGLLCGLAIVSSDAPACAAVWRSGDQVEIAAEEALIVWDEKAKVQHFIRRADFSGKAKDFGFLVPTPTKPELAEADKGTFDFLARAGMEVRKSVDPAERRLASAVVVLGVAKVAGYDAAILRASDAGSLDQWLKQHGYASSPALMDWYGPYVAKGWVITAFRIASDNEARVSTKAVRMSFPSDEPFFPYTEPKLPRQERSLRLLRIYVLAASEMATSGVPSVRAVELRPQERDKLLKLAGVPAGGAADSAWLTVFEDHKVMRGDSDLRFHRHGAGALVIVAAVAAGLLIAAYFVLRRQ